LEYSRVSLHRGREGGGGAREGPRKGAQGTREGREGEAKGEGEGREGGRKGQEGGWILKPPAQVQFTLLAATKPQQLSKCSSPANTKNTQGLQTQNTGNTVQ